MTRDEVLLEADRILLLAGVDPKTEWFRDLKGRLLELVDAPKDEALAS